MVKRLLPLIILVLLLTLPGESQVGTNSVNPWEDTVTVKTPDGTSQTMSGAQADDLIIRFLNAPGDGTLVVSDTHQSMQLVKHGGSVTETTERPTRFYARMIEYGRLTQCSNSLKNMGTALEMYAVDHKNKYPERLQDLVPDYLKVLPACPSGTHAAYGYKVDNSGKDPGYVMHCTGHHEGADVPAGYPQYNSVDGLVVRPK